MSTRPAATAAPRSCAFAAFSIVFGPIAGMSSLRSCPRLGALTNTPAATREAQPPVRAHLRDAREHRVGAFRRLDRQNPAGGDDRALPGVERREGVEEASAEGNVRLVLRRGRAGAERTDGSEEDRRNLVRADHADSLALEDRGQADEKPVVPAAQQLRELGRPLDRAPIEPEVGEFRPRHRADDHHLADRARSQRGEQLADLANADPDVRVSFDRRIRRADDADAKRRPAGAAHLPCDLERERAGAAKDGERRA